MELIIKKTIGNTNYTFVFEGKNLYEVITESQKLSFGDVKTCGICSNSNLVLSAHKAQDKYKYTEVKCLKCKASLNFGQKTDDPDVFYLRKNEDKKLDWKAYTPTNSRVNETVAEKKSDLPF